MAFTKSEYDFINLAVSIKGQADRLGVEHNGVPHEGVVARIAQRAVNAEARIAELEAGVGRVREIHKRDECGFCAECSWEYPEASYDAIDNDVPWPCQTVVALGQPVESEGE